MEKNLSHNEKEYKIKIEKGRVKVTELGTRPTSDAAMIAIAGKTEVETEYSVDEQTHAEVIVAAGWKFSKSKAWAIEFDHCFAPIRKARREARRQ